MWYIIMSCFETLVSPIFFTYPIGLRAPGRTPEHTWTDIDITAGQGRPSAMDASTNYYLLLGIFDPDDDLSGTSDADPEVMESIRHAISDKQLESGRASRNPRKAIQLEGKRRLDLLQHAETALDTQAKRERQFDEALAIVDTAMAKHVGNFASKGFIAAPRDRSHRRQDRRRDRLRADADHSTLVRPAQAHRHPSHGRAIRRPQTDRAAETRLLPRL